MRLQLIIATLAVADAAHADTKFDSKIQIYTDNDHTTVVSPLVHGSADVDADTNVSLGYIADAVTTASVDVVSQASKTVVHDTRHQVSATASHVFAGIKVNVGYSYSRENDYQSHSLGGGLEKELFDKTTTLTLGYGLGLNTVGRANDSTFSRSLDVNTLSATWTQIITERTVTQLSYELADAEGFQSSVYRFVPVRAMLGAAPSLWVAETDPQSRWRHAVVLGVNHAVGETSSIQGDYRIYRDTWGITSHTFGARYYTDLTPSLQLRLRERFYTQGTASFYQENYTAVSQYMTFDRELSSLWSNTFGAKLVYRVTPRVETELKADLFYYQYSEFAPLLSRTGANLGIGLSLIY